MVKRKPKVKRYRKHQFIIKITLLILTILADIFWCYALYSINTYASLSSLIFIIVNIVVFALVLRLNWLCLYNIASRSIVVAKKLTTTSLVMLLLGGFGSYYLFKVNSNVAKITDTSNETITTSSFVTASSNVVSLTDLDKQKVGVMQDNGQNEIAKQELSSQDIDATYMLYSDYPTLFNDLETGVISAAIVPTDYQTRFANDTSINSNLANLTNLGEVSLDNQNNFNNVEGNNIDLTSTPFTILLAGIDEGRSDALMLASFNPVSLRLTLTSIPRDSYVPISCYAANAKDKINAARSVSRDCMIQTVEDLMGVNVDFYFESNFKGIVDIVDALGGITINSPIEFDAQDSSDERGHFTVHIFEGEQRLDGEQALAYARERHAFLTGDFQRQINQQQVIEAMLMEAMRINDLNTMMNVLDAAGNNVSTNLSVDQLINLFNTIMKKAQRFPSQEHVEQMIDIVSTRLTAYTSFLWDEANYQTISIVIPYQGAIDDARELIERNLELSTEVTNPASAMLFDATMLFNQPTITYEMYDEPLFEPTLTPSYYCYIGNGQWEDGYCNCFGNEYVEGIGCVVPEQPTEEQPYVEPASIPVDNEQSTTQPETTPSSVVEESPTSE